jgi:hypothetical protein
MVYDAIYVVFCAVIYSLEYSGILYIMCFPILVMHGEPADLLSIIYAKHSLYWSRRGQAPHSFLVTVLSPKSNIVILLFINPLCVEWEYCCII